MFTDGTNYERSNGSLMAEPTRTWKCEKCGRTIERYRGMDDIQCVCGAWYNSFGQRLRDDWQGNPSNYDEDIGDLEGFEIQQLAKEQHGN
jgi:predicted ATP-dependent serine protease